MEFINYVVEDRIAHVRLDRGRSNAMHAPLIKEFTTLLSELEQNPAVSGMLLHGKPDFFSSGLDLIELYDYNEVEIKDFWNQFIDMVRAFISFSKPSVAAISGHSPAGGCVLALCCDYRVMATGDYVIGLNELPVGIVVPSAIFELYGFWIGQGNAYRNLMEGKLLNPNEALSQGLVDELVSYDKLVTTAETKLRAYLKFEPNSWRRSKLNLRKQLIATFEADQSNDIEAILQQWWSTDTRTVLKTIIEGLKNKK